MRCAPKTKVNFIKDVFELCGTKQTFIFVNTVGFAETIHRMLKKAGYGASIMHSKMDKEERDETMEGFRNQVINVLITTNLIARGIDVPECQLVVNYDVPTKYIEGKGGKHQVGDAEVYLHRIGRTGRFGTPGVAITIYDRDIDKELFDQILDHYKMDVPQLMGPDHLTEIFEKLEDEANQKAESNGPMEEEKKQ